MDNAYIEKMDKSNLIHARSARWGARWLAHDVTRVDSDWSVSSKMMRKTGCEWRTSLLQD